MKKIGLLIITLFMMFLVTSCNKEKYINLTYNTTKIELTVGDTTSVKPNIVVGKKVKEYILTYELSSDIAKVDSEGILTAEKSGTTVVTVTANNKEKSSATLEIIIVDREYKINLDADSGILDNSEIVFIDATKVELPTPTKEGHTFAGWYENDSLVENLENRNYNLVAKWNINTYNVKFVDESQNVLFSQDYAYMETFTLEDYNLEGYYFDGWYIDDKKIDTYTMGLEDVTIVGKFTKKIIVTVHLNNGESNQLIETREGITLAKLSELKIPSYVDHRFDNFYYDEECSLAMKPNVKLTDDINLYVKWMRIYQIKYDLNGGTTNVEFLSEYVAEDLEYGDYELKQPYREGYYFRGWYDNPDFTGDLYYKIKQGTKEDISLYARWIDATLENALVSVIGDSNSAFEGMIPSGFTPCYAYTKNNGILSVNNMWWRILQKTIGYKQGIINAYAGTTVMSEYGPQYATELKSRLRRSIPANKIGPDIVIIYMGTNDCLVEGLNVANFEDAYRTMINNLYELLPSVQIFVCNIAYEKNKASDPDILANHLVRKGQVNDTIAKLATEFNIPLIDFKNAYDENTEGVLYDTIHPTALGQKKLAEKAIEAFKQFYNIEA